MTDLHLNFELLTRLGAKSKTFAAGEKVFLEDDIGANLYVVTSGRVDVITYGTVLENVRSGGIIGEMALIDDGLRSAAAIATEPTDVLAIDKPTFLALIREEPEFALHVMRLLTNRLRKMNQHF